jgi:4-aminobutyrate aminotransferase-like enzyme
MVDGGKAAADLLSTAKGFGGTPELLLSLFKDGFIREAGGAEPAAAPAAGAVTDAEREKLYAAKAAMRRYIKMAAVEAKALTKVVDDVKAPGDLAAALREVKRVFEANGFGEAFANLQSELSKA